MNWVEEGGGTYVVEPVRPAQRKASSGIDELIRPLNELISPSSAFDSSHRPHSNVAILTALGNGYMTAISPIEWLTAQIIVPDKMYPSQILAGPPLASDEPDPSQRPIPMDEPSAIMVMCRVLRRRWSSQSAPKSSVRLTTEPPRKEPALTASS